MRKVLIITISLFLTGCSIVRIDTSSIDNILKVILTKNNNLYNQVGNGYKYYVPGGVTYIDSDDLNDVLYSDGVYYYLYIDAINYYYDVNNNYKNDDNVYYSKVINKSDGYKYNGYLKIEKIDELNYITFIYNNAKIEAVVDDKKLNDTILNSTYILSTIKYNKNIIKLMLDDDYFTNKIGKYNFSSTKGSTEKFVLKKDK